MPDFPWAASLPTPTQKPLALRVNPSGERALREGHPWLFDRAILRQRREGRPGDLAVIFDGHNRFLAVGLFDPTSAIRVRVLHHGHPQPIDEAWYGEQVALSVARRAGVIDAQTDGYRLVHGENDGLPGLVVDRYADTLVIKLYTPAWIPHLPAIAAGLLAVCPAHRIVLRLARRVQGHDQYLHGRRDGEYLWGRPADEPLHFREHGLRFEVDPVRGQKTGFFLDQRENRRRVRALSRERQILNVFAYSGAFSIYAAAGGAREVTSVDISRPALEAARRNFELNLDHPAVVGARHECVAGDAFRVLVTLAEAGRRFDLVIIDPPAFARRKSQVPQALGAYARLTQLGLAVLRVGGTLVQASCSSRVQVDAFLGEVEQAAAAADRPLSKLQLFQHPPDHPIGFPEGAYLKCIFAEAHGH